MTHAIAWFELPCTDFDRAVEFYETIFDREMEIYEEDPELPEQGRSAMFPADDGGVSGMVVETDSYTTEAGAEIAYRPTADSGPVLYLSVEGDVDDVLGRVESAGGEVFVPKEPLGEMEGHYALIADSEGNRVGLMSDR